MSKIMQKFSQGFRVLNIQGNPVLFYSLPNQPSRINLLFPNQNCPRFLGTTEQYK